MITTTPSTTDAAPRRRGLGGQRGAAATELAISLLLFLPLFAGLTFAGEILSAGAKVQEAEIAGVWEITAYQLHDFTGNGQASDGLYQQSATSVITAVQNDLTYGLNSFDGSTTTSTPGRQLAFLSVTPITLDCGGYQPPSQGIHHEPSFVPLNPFDSLANYYKNGNPANSFYTNTVPANQFLHTVSSQTSGATSGPLNYISCQGHVSVTRDTTGFDAQLSRWTHENGLLAETTSLFSFCGSGATMQGCEKSNGNAQGGIVVLADDWSVGNGASNPLGSQGNPEFFNVGQAVFGGGTGQQKIEEVLNLLLQKKLADQAATDTFKAGFGDRQDTPSSMANDVGSASGSAAVLTHLTPYEAQGGDPAQVYAQRVNGNYLGSPDPSFEDAP